MVDIAQLVSASDCGSEGRGFESHYPPHKNPEAFASGIFYGVDNGLDSKGRQPQRGCKKVSGGHFFSPWENPCGFDGTPEGCWQRCRFKIRTTPKKVFFFYKMNEILPKKDFVKLMHRPLRFLWIWVKINEQTKTKGRLE